MSNIPLNPHFHWLNTVKSVPKLPTSSASHMMMTTSDLSGYAKAPDWNRLGFESMAHA
jgi:hypothetical protein